MNKISKNSYIYVLLLAMLYSCSIQKRRYMPGYYLNSECRNKDFVKRINCEKKNFNALLTSADKTCSAVTYSTPALLSVHTKLFTAPFKGIYHPIVFNKFKKSTHRRTLPPKVKTALLAITGAHESKKTVPKAAKSGLVISIIALIVAAILLYTLNILAPIILLLPDAILAFISLVLSIQALGKILKHPDLYSGLGIAIIGLALSLLVAVFLAVLL